MMHKFAYALALIASMMIGAECGEGQLKTEELVDKIKTEITLGMTRAEAEKELAQLPVSYVYVPREDLERVSDTSFEGRLLSGRFDVATPHEATVSYMKQALIFIALDEDERVVNVRVEGFGLAE